MEAVRTLNDEIHANGFATIPEVYSEEEVEQIISAIEEADSSGPTFRKSNDLFAIRQFFKEVPSAKNILLNQRLIQLISAAFGNDYFIVKSIYFDKPGNSNWFVAYHQDLTISVDKKMEHEGYAYWTKKERQFAVQPPLTLLEDNFTVRIHLDDTDENNGALKVIPASHRKGIYRPETIDWQSESETVCPVPKGGVFFMRPLLLHASSRTTNQKKRRVVHVEFSRSALPADLQWAELLPLN